MKRYSTLLSSLSVVAVLGACAPANEITTRAELDPLGFRDNPNASVVEVQAEALNRMADQLVQDSKVPRAYNNAIVACGVAIFTPNKASTCGQRGERPALFGQGGNEPVELVPAVALVDDIQDMNGQMDTLETGLPELIAKQDAALADLNERRAEGAMSQAEFDAQVDAITKSRARIAEALDVTAAHAKQANSNMRSASERGQIGLGWHMSATERLAQEATIARAQLGLREQPAEDLEDYVSSSAPVLVSAYPITAVPRPGEYR